MPVILNGKTLKSPLIYVPLAGSGVVGVVSHGMGRRHPAEKAPHLAVLTRTQKEMPMVRHDLIRIHFHIVAIQPFGQYPLKGRKITVLTKYGRPRVTAIQNMIQSTSSISTFWSRHKRTIPNPPATVKEKGVRTRLAKRVLTPFLFSCGIGVACVIIPGAK